MSDNKNPELLPESEPSASEHTPQSEMQRAKLVGSAERTKLAATAVERLNYKANVPYEMVRDGKDVKYTFENLQEAFKKNDWKQVVFIAFGLIFGKKNNVDALGMFAEGVEKLAPEEQVDIIEQTEKIDVSQMGWKDRLRTSLISTSVEYSLFRRGYDRTGTATHDKSRTLKIEPGTKLQDVVDKDVWAKLNEEQDGKKVLLGPLTHLQTLDCPCYLYFTADGYPIYVATTDTANPRVPFFAKKRKETPPEGKEMDLESRIAYLESKLERGDILVSSTAPGKYKDVLRKGFSNLGREKQKRKGDEDMFFGIHGMVYLGGGNIIHVQEGGHSRTTLRDLVLDTGKGLDSAWADAVTVSRMSLPKDKRDAFASAAETMAVKITKYDYAGAYTRGKEIARSENGEIVTASDHSGDEKAICLDVITEGAKGIDDTLAGKLSALDMYEYLTPVAAINFKREG